MSTIDTRSYATYANAAFIGVSGFERDEIPGQPHNRVRHPDMPAEAFADMWATLKAGLSWTALVKNRRKNGDHCWVRANAAPIARHGQVTGYMSVRPKPSRGEVEASDALYRRFREQRAGGLRFHQGLIVRGGLLAWASCLQTMLVRWRLHCGVCGLGALALAGAALAGVAGAALGGLAAALGVLTPMSSLALEAQFARPLEQVLKQALRVAAGQPGEAVHLNRVDEIGMILRAVNQSGLNLRSLVDGVGEQVGGVQTASPEIAQGSLDLSARTEHAASNLQETAASMEQMTATVKNSADIARQAAGLADGARAARWWATWSGPCGRSPRPTARSRTSIGTIDGIAFHTNILALNAAVEAARAGGQGRGFAVVAGEMRSRAQRSAEAAKQIKGLISDSVEKVQSGAREVDEAGRAMGEIVAQVRRVNDLMAEISNATAEQAAGIGQVNVAVSQLDQMTQQNAALVEQSAAAASSLQGQAELSEAVRVFKR